MIVCVSMANIITQNQRTSVMYWRYALDCSSSLVQNYREVCTCMYWQSIKFNFFRCLVIVKDPMKMKMILLQKWLYKKVIITGAHQEVQALFCPHFQLEVSSFVPRGKAFLMIHLQIVAILHLRRYAQAIPCLTKRRRVVLWWRIYWRSSCPRLISRCLLCRLQH